MDGLIPIQDRRRLAGTSGPDPGRGFLMAESTQTAGAPPELWVGSYRLLRPLGAGGMSSVFHAVHVQTGAEVALKILPRALAKNPTLLHRFLREAKSAESLEHPSIVAIYDRGEDQGRHYLALEFVPGGDLHERVRSGGALGVREAIGIIRSAAEGLSYAAGQGVIHRDVKPANLLLTAEGTVKVTDLGLALQVEDEDERVTRDGTTVGTVDYMAPEQARDSRATSIRSDLYSLGCTFYYLLAGAAPFAGGDVGSKLRRHALEAPPDIRAVRPDVPPALARLIQRMMAKSPNARFADYEQLIRALADIPAAETDADGDPQLVPLDDEDPSSSSFMGPGGSSVARAATVEIKAASGGSRLEPGGSRTGPDGSRVPPQVPRAQPAPPHAAQAPMLREILDDEPPAPLPPPIMAKRRGREPATEEYIGRGLLLGLAIALAGLGLYYAASTLTPRSAARPPEPDRREASQEPGDPTPAPTEGSGESAIMIPGEPTNPR